MKKIKVGYLPLYIKLYDDRNPKSREPLVAYMKTLVSMLEGQGLEVVLADVCRDKPEFEAAVAMFNEAGVDAVVTQHLAYSPSLESIEALLKLEADIVVLDTTPDYELISVAGYHNGIARNHGIHGVQDMCNLLKRNGRAYQICAGHAMHSDVVAEAVGMCRAAAAANAYRNARVGSVGGEFPGMGDFAVSAEEYRDAIGAQVFAMSLEEAADYLAKVSDEEIGAEMEKDSRDFTVEVTNRENYREAIRAGLAVRKWAADQSLTALTVNFLRLDQYGLPKMPFAECSKLMRDGYGYAGEGDVLTAGLVGALRGVYQDVTFTEMFCPDWKEDVILLNHMGECNLSLAQWRPVLTDTPFVYNSCGDTVAAYMCLRPGRGVYVNLAPMGNGAFTLILTEADILNRGLERGAYRNSMQGWLKPCKPLRAFLKEFSLHGATHHSAFVYNADIAELEAFGRMMGFDVAVIRA